MESEGDLHGHDGDGISFQQSSIKVWSASLNVDVHAEDADVEDHRDESAHADAVGERPHVLDGELAHVSAADGAEEGAEDVDDDGEGQVEDEEERRPVVAVQVGEDCRPRNAIDLLLWQSIPPLA